MPEKLSIEVIKHSDSDYRVICKQDVHTQRMAFDDKEKLMIWFNTDLLRAAYNFIICEK